MPLSQKERFQIQSKRALRKLLAWAGTKAILAYELGVSRQVVGNWFERGQISLEGVKLIRQHRQLRKVVTAEEMRPDIFKPITRPDSYGR